MSGNATAGGVLGVGIIGAGPVTQAIHLPSLARLADVFAVRHIMDVDSAVAGSVAGRAAGPSAARPKHGTSVAALLDDPDVDVVAICSPHRFHAEQLIAACRAGKKAVLCEKPFAMERREAALISAASAETGVPIIVGAMHTFDPAWLAAEAAWGDLPETAHTIRSSIVLPPNSRFEDFATEVLARPEAAAPDYTDPDVIRSALHGGIMGLAIHDLPLVRRFLPGLQDFRNLEVLQAHHVRPFGYVVSLRAGARSIELRAVMSDTWKPEWVFEAISDHSALRVDFTPSYVQAGSAIATITSGSSSTSYGPFGSNGYEGEWRELARIARSTGAPASTETLIDDLSFALAIADACASPASAAETTGARA